MEHDEEMGASVAFDMFNKIARAEWDTLLFFYGVILAVGGLDFIGHIKWAPVIALGYAASIGVHMWINKGLF